MPPRVTLHLPTRSDLPGEVAAAAAALDRTAFGRALARAGADSGRVDLVLVRSGELRRLNRRFRSKDRATDVLAFDYRDPVEPPSARPRAAAPSGRSPDRTRAGGDAGVPSRASQVWGDVFVSADAARDQARERGIPVPEELARLFLHGSLHLLGYRDDSRGAAARMEEVQEALLTELLAPREPRRRARARVRLRR